MYAPYIIYIYESKNSQISSLDHIWWMELDPTTYIVTIIKMYEINKRNNKPKKKGPVLE